MTTGDLQETFFFLIWTKFYIPHIYISKPTQVQEYKEYKSQAAFVRLSLHSRRWLTTYEFS